MKSSVDLDQLAALDLQHFQKSNVHRVLIRSSMVLYIPVAWVLGLKVPS